MDERDAFGREIGEDTLADMGWAPPRADPAPQWVASSVVQTLAQTTWPASQTRPAPSMGGRPAAS